MGFLVPKSVSATSLMTARECMARYKAENIEYARGWDNPAALLGTTCHSALEEYVQMVYVDKSMEPDADFLESLFVKYFWQNFGRDGNEEVKATGIRMMNSWSERESGHMNGRNVLTLELKEAINIETPVGPLKMNFILDRFDQIGETEYEIIDYKSSFFNETPYSMLKLLQPFIYAVAMYIKYPHATKMLVTYDMLRYSPVTIEVTKDQAKAAFAEIYEIIEKIIATDDDTPYEELERLNKGCNYCIRKASCRTLQKNIDVGGLMSLDLQGQIDLRTEIELKLKGLRALQGDLESVIEESMGKDQKTELDTGRSRAYFTVPKRNEITSQARARELATPAVFDRYAKPSEINITEFKKMLKDPAIPADNKEELASLLKPTHKDPKLNFENTRSPEKTAQVSPSYTGKLAPAVPAAPIPGLEE